MRRKGSAVTQRRWLQRARPPPDAAFTLCAVWRRALRYTGPPMGLEADPMEEVPTVPYSSIELATILVGPGPSLDGMSAKLNTVWPMFA